MTTQPDTPDSAHPFFYAVCGTLLLAIGGGFFVNLNEDPEVFMTLSVIFGAPGFYLVVAGAVARGIFGARR